MEENDVRFVETKSDIAKNPYARHIRNMEGLLIITDQEPNYTEPKTHKRRNRRLLGKTSLVLLVPMGRLGENRSKYGS